MNFLRNRSQATILGGVKSQSISLHGGVPQGTVRGPKIFYLYINDLPVVVFTCIPYLYADDLQLLFSCKIEHIEEAVKLINIDLSDIAKYANNIALKINASKYSVILIGQPCDLKKICIDNLPPIKINNSTISYSNNIKNLGVYFDSNLSWDVQVRHISSKFMGNIYALNRCRNFIPVALKPKLVVHFYFLILIIVTLCSMI
jgi:hypothetical protein